MSTQTQQLIIREMYMYDVKAVKFDLPLDDSIPGSTIPDRL